MKRLLLGALTVIISFLVVISSATARTRLIAHKGGVPQAVCVQAAGAPVSSSGPTALEPLSGNVLLFLLRAEGVQIYECKPVKGSNSEYEWVLKAPDATLFDERGEKAGTHFGGPTWQANDASKIVAEKMASVNAPDGKAIPWLLLQIKSREGNGVFSKVTYIQRVDTWAGLAPATGATKENAGNIIRVKYEATYRFYGATQD